MTRVQFSCLALAMLKTVENACKEFQAMNPRFIKESLNLQACCQFLVRVQCFFYKTTTKTRLIPKNKSAFDLCARPTGRWLETLFHYLIDLI